MIKIKFAKKLMGERKLGIELDSFFAVIFGDGAEIETEQKARSEKIGGSGVGRDLKHFREGGASVGVVFCLNVSDAENVGGVDAGARIPGLDFFEIWNCFRRFAGEVKRETGELRGLVVTWIFLDRALEGRNGVAIVALAVINDSEFVREIFCGGIGFYDFAKGGECFIEFALVGEAVNLVVRRRSRRWRILREGKPRNEEQEEKAVDQDERCAGFPLMKRHRS